MNEALIEAAPSPAAWAPGAEPCGIDTRFLPAYRRFAAGHCLRQAIVFPAGDTGSWMAQRRKTAVFLCELDTGALWALRIPRHVATSEESLHHLARALREETLTRSKWKLIEERLHDQLEYPISILDPRFRADDAQMWQVRATAIDFRISGLGPGDRNGEFFAGEVADLEQVAAEKLDQLLARFTSGLDTEVFELASCGAGCKIIRYNYFLGTDRAVRRNRLQFLSTLPLLVPTACGELDDPPNYTGRLREAVDQGAPIVREICAWFQLPPNVVRALIGKDIAHLGEFWSARVFALLRVLAAIAPEKRPDDAPSWARFNEACRLLSLLLKRPINTPAGLSSIAALSRNGYRGAEKLVEEEFLTEEQIGVIDQCFSTLNICLRWEASKAERSPKPLAGTMPLLDKLIAELSLARLRDVALRWRNANLVALARYAKRMTRPKRRTTWAPLVAESVTIGGLRFRELASAAALRTEGQRMKHCVGTYAPTCEAGRTHIFSCSAPAGTPLSTLEVRLARDQTGAVVPSITQHLGPNNNPLLPQCREAAKGLIELLREEPHRSRMAEVYELYTRPGEVPRFQGMTLPHIQCAVEAFRTVLSGKMAYDRLVEEALKFHVARPGVDGSGA